MAEVTTALIKELRERTGAGIADCKKMLIEADGDIDKAIDLLREKGLAQAAKKSGRIAAEGIVDSYIHMNGKIGVLVEVNCETDFVAKTDQFKTLVHDIALQIAAANPLYLSKAEVPQDAIDHETEVLRAHALEDGTPEKIIDRMVEGRIEKYYKDNCLLEQQFVKDPDKTISNLLTEATVAIGEKIAVRRFVRYERGEGLQKREDDFAAEVAKQAGLA
jgi:elongation factor Ts